MATSRNRQIFLYEIWSKLGKPKIIFIRNRTYARNYCWQKLFDKPITGNYEIFKFKIRGLLSAKDNNISNSISELQKSETSFITENHSNNRSSAFKKSLQNISIQTVDSPETDQLNRTNLNVTAKETTIYDHLKQVRKKFSWMF